ncbi:MAG: DinB family protein [Cyclobacteriaceae bacterium]
MKYKPQDGFPYYFHLAQDGDLPGLFSSAAQIEFLRKIPEEKGTYRYLPQKWSIKQIVGHIADHERIKMYRAFLLSRNQQIELWGYDQNTLVRNARFDELTMSQLISDLQNIRASSLSFINTLSDKQLAIKGVARGHEISLEDFLRSIIGHERHHIEVIKRKYQP